MGEIKTNIAGYFPVLHNGYLDLLQHSQDADVGVLDVDILGRFGYLKKDIRALRPEDAQRLIAGLGRTATLLTTETLPIFLNTNHTVMPDDDISRSIADQYPDADIELAPIFLRWDRHAATVNKPVHADRIEPLSNDSLILRILAEEAHKSPSWWRSVGAAIVDNDRVVTKAHNSSLPTEFSTAIDGDPRITANRGESIERSIDIHAEASLVAECAKNGTSIDGLSIFVTTFPCPACAKLIAGAGIKECYFIEGYASVDGEEILRANNVEIIKVDVEIPPFPTDRLKPYPS